MDNGTNGSADWFLHTTDSALCSTSLSNQPTPGRMSENTEPSVEASFPQCTSDYIVESVETTKNSPLALEEGVARATALMRKVLEEERKMERRGYEIQQRARQRTEREARELEEEANPGPGFTIPNENVTSEGSEQGLEELSVPQEETSSISS